MIKIKYKHVKKMLAFSLALFSVVSCDQEEVNEIAPRDNFLISLSGRGVVFENLDTYQVPFGIGFTTKQDSQLTVEIEGLNGATYGTDYTTIPDASSGTITFDVPAGSSSVDFQVIPIEIPNMGSLPTPDRMVEIKLVEVTGEGLTLSEQSESFELTIRDKEFNVDILASTSFEEPVAGDVNNYSAPDSAELPNNSGENSVDYTSIGKEMGFDTSYVPGEEGGADSSLYLGVTNVVNESGDYNIGSFASGAQAYVVSDADGLLEIVFDEVPVPEDINTLRIIFSTHFVSSSWEDDDEFDLFWRTQDGDELLLSFRANENDDMTDQPDGSGVNIEGEWFTFFTDIANKKTGSLVIQVGSDSGSELVFIDDIVIGTK